MNVSPSVLASRLMVQARLRHIQAFVKIVELGSVKRAAQALGLTQPSTSHVLADLEQLLACRLFDRHARGMTPTAIALALLPYCHRILESVYSCAEVTSAMTSTATAVVRVAAITSAVSGMLTHALPPFTRRHPDISVSVLETDVRGIGELIAQDAIDLALGREPSVVPEGWAFKSLLDDRYIIAAGPQHPLADRRRVALSTLLRETWILVPVPSTPHFAFDQLIKDQAVRPHIKQVATRSQTIIAAFLQNERLVTVLPKSMVQHQLDRGQLVQLAIELPLHCEPLGVLAPIRGSGGAAERFSEFLEQQLPTLLSAVTAQARRRD
ncbi:MAG: LysR family transcriptional regulator [Pusillimonas sp.]